jgi:hypothetical protein
MMKEWLTWFFNLWRMQSRDYGTTSRAACKGRGYLVSVIIAETAGATASGTILNGDNSDGDNFIPFSLAANTSLTFSPALPVPFNKGLYVNIASGAIAWHLSFVRSEPG